MSKSNLKHITECWCGCLDFEKFSDTYIKCKSCKTLIASPRKMEEFFDVSDDDDSFYGKNYWLKHQSEDYDYPDIFKRSRSDFIERCLYWLKTIMMYKLPPSNSLELGCSHGALVHLMKKLGYSSRGLELSNWVVEYGKSIFGIDIINGKIEDTEIPPTSLDIVAMMDVIEHFPNPIETMTAVSNVIKNDGILVIQTPCFNEIPYQEMLNTNHVFLEQLKSEEHLYLFTKGGMEKLLGELGFKYIQFENALFPYDMFVFASKQPMEKDNEQVIIEFLESNPENRAILGLLDLYQEKVRIENEAIERLNSVNRYKSWLEESEADRAARLEIIQERQKKLEESEADRNARLEVIKDLQNKLDKYVTNCTEELEVVQDLQKRLEESEADRAARLEVIQDLQKRLEESEADRAARLEIIQRLQK